MLRVALGNIPTPHQTDEEVLLVKPTKLADHPRTLVAILGIGGFFEYGSANNSAKPFLRPALNNNKDAAEAEFKRSFSEELDKEIAKL